MSRYTVQFTPKAGDWLRSQRDAKLQSRIVAAAERLADNPRPPGCVKLSGVEDVWRIRIGDYRILYEIQNARLVVLVIRIANRREAYR